MENTALGLTVDQIALIGKWEATKALAKSYVDEERQLRAEIVATLFDAAVVKGTENLPLGNGYKLKCVKTEDYKLKNADAVDAILANFSASHGEALVKWKPELSVSTYNLLSDEEKALFNDVLEIKPGMPQVSLEEPKVSK
jgi:hypothetical protein